MKVSLVVMNPGKTAGHTIPITLSQFMIGRDPQCNLRPSSPVISKRHCAILIKNGKVSVRDFDSTNGTFIGDIPVKGEVPLEHDNILKVGPLTFRVAIERPVPVDKPTPPPKKKNPGSDEEVADMLLSLPEGQLPEEEMQMTDEDDSVPGGSTVMEMPVGLLPSLAALEGKAAPLAKTPPPPQKQALPKSPTPPPPQKLPQVATPPPAPAKAPPRPAAAPPKPVAPPPAAPEPVAAGPSEEEFTTAQQPEEEISTAEPEEEIATAEPEEEIATAESDEEVAAADPEETPPPREPEPQPAPAPSPAAKKPEQKPPQHNSARDAARAILEKYVKRNRGS